MDRKHVILERVFGYRQFRQGQEEIIDALLSGRDVLGIMPTGGGKSICYQVPALLLDGVTLVISPLISLMCDQVSALVAAGVPAAYINSSLTPEQIRTVYRRMRMGAYKIIYVAPERLLTAGFLDAVSAVIVDMVVADEAHCISQWGQDFRPGYLKIADFIRLLPVRPVVSAFTATATERVRQDVAERLELHRPLRVITGFDRPNLYFSVIRPRQKQAALLSLLEQRRDKSGIIYCSTRKDTDKVYDLLQSRGFRATRYHAGLSEEERRANQEAFVYDVCPVMAATNAFGMGIDKSNVSYVIHYNMPQSLEAYYQEAGRAGRDGSGAECILMFAQGDIHTAKFLIENSSDKEDPEEQAEVIRQNLGRLETMVQYCRTDDCLRAFILRYFGEKAEGRCGKCGNCLAAADERNVTREARMIFSAIQRVRQHLGYSLGAQTIADILKGSANRRIRELRLNTLPVYGIMKERKLPGIRQLIDALERKGCLHTDLTTGALTLTDRGFDVLNGEEAVWAAVEEERSPEARRAETDGLTEEEAALYDRLRRLCGSIARREHKPVYMVFNNASLLEMALRKPRSLEEFLQISGVGTKKAEKYGAEFLWAIWD